MILFVSTTLPITGMTGSPLHMQWPVTSQLHDSFLKENNCFVFFITDQTPRPTLGFLTGEKNVCIGLIDN
jgi:hypothetical protein